MPVKGGKVVHVSCEPFDKYVGRVNPRFPEGSKWQNPYVVGPDGTREEVMEKYKTYFFKQTDLLLALEELEDQVLGCWCKGKYFECHAEFLRDMSNLNKALKRVVLR